MFLSAIRIIAGILGAAGLLCVLALSALPEQMLDGLIAKITDQATFFRVVGLLTLVGGAFGVIVNLKETNLWWRLIWIAVVAATISGLITVVQPFWLLPLGEYARFVYAVALSLALPGILMFTSAKKA